MRFSTALTVFALFAASASASYTPLHRRQSVPSCANSCYANPDLGSCKSGDNTCLCNSSTFVQGTFDCVEAACKGQDLADAIAGAAALCAAAGVNLPSASGAEFSATASLGSTASSGAGATSEASNSAAGASTAAASSPAPSTTTNGALSSTANTAFLGLAAIGALALAL
ncbi:hypothetical protein DFH06DRAFT_1335443 [Mycena polygramma]|nr:hypothetical protein DFH06DRAFT_1335443 [Mycena polygramma]